MLNKQTDPYFSGIIHNLKNATGCISGSAELIDLLLKNPGNNADKIKLYNSTILEVVSHINEILAEYLKDQYNSNIINRRKKIDLVQVVQKQASLFRTSHSHSDKDFLVFESERSSILVSANENELIQVIQNLLKNAFEAARDSNSIRIKVKITSDNDITRIQIEDNGVGVPAKIIEKIFSPYFTTKIYKEENTENGSGLGLFMCKKIIEDHNGTIVVENIKSSGARFTVSLPINS